MKLIATQLCEHYSVNIRSANLLNKACAIVAVMRSVENHLHRLWNGWPEAVEAFAGVLRAAWALLYMSATFVWLDFGT